MLQVRGGETSRYVPIHGCTYERREPMCVYVYMYILGQPNLNSE